jgi:hypothetical protein
VLPTYVPQMPKFGNTLYDPIYGAAERLWRGRSGLQILRNIPCCFFVSALSANWLKAGCAVRQDKLDNP